MTLSNVIKIINALLCRCLSGSSLRFLRSAKVNLVLRQASICPLPHITSSPGAADFAPSYRAHPGKPNQVLAAEQEGKAVTSAAISPARCPSLPSQ